MPIIHAYLNDKDADYNAVWKIYEATDKMWFLFAKYFLISAIIIIAALGSEWLEGVKIVGIHFCLLLSRFAWAAS